LESIFIDDQAIIPPANPKDIILGRIGDREPSLPSENDFTRKPAALSISGQEPKKI
jgi:hypothetical protein